MLERKKQYTEPAGRKEWSDGGQKELVHPSDKIVLPMDKRLSMGNCYDERTKKNTVLKGANKMNITNQVYDRMVWVGRKILKTDFSNGPMLLGPLWLLWHGEWRLALQSYLPLTALYVAAHGLVSYGAAQDSMHLFRLGTMEVAGCIVVAVIINFRWGLRWPKIRHGKGGHWGMPLIWLGGLYLAVGLVMRLGILL